jgi:Glucoamylase and related glycosyl hydrolases
MICAPAFDYGRASHRIEKDGSEIIFVSEGKDKTVLRLRSQVPVQIENGAVAAQFTLRAGDRATFVLEDATERESPAAARHYTVDAFKATMNFWRVWIGKSTYKGRWREMVNRSALALKLLTSQSTAPWLLPRHSGCPKKSAACATGITGSHGFATPRLRSMR